MELTVKHAQMNKDEEGAFLGKTVFEVDGHKEPYEITFYSKKGKEWDYSLHFHDEPGDEDEMNKVDAYLEEDDDAFDALLDAAMETVSE